MFLSFVFQIFNFNKVKYSLVREKTDEKAVNNSLISYPPDYSPLAAEVCRRIL
jgi:hypothetical protein